MSATNIVPRESTRLASYILQRRVVHALYTATTPVHTPYCRLTLEVLELPHGVGLAMVTRQCGKYQVTPRRLISCIGFEL